MIQAGQSVDRRNDVEKLWSLTWMKERSRGADRNLGWSRVVEKRRRVERITHGGRIQFGQRDSAVLSHQTEDGIHSCAFAHTCTWKPSQTHPLHHHCKHKTPWDGRSQQTPPSTSSSPPKPINSLNHFQLFSPPPVSEMPLFEGDGVKSGSWLLRDCSCIHSGGFGGQSWGRFSLCLHYYSHQNLDICWADALIWEYLRTFAFEMKMKPQN